MVTLYVQFQVAEFTEILQRHLCGQEARSFRSSGKLKFSPEMREAFAKLCLDSVHFVPVEGHPEDDFKAYVIEIEVFPTTEVCQELVFQYCDFSGKICTYFRYG